MDKLAVKAYTESKELKFIMTAFDSHTVHFLLGIGVIAPVANGHRVEIAIVVERLSQLLETDRFVEALRAAAHKAGETLGVSEVHLEGLQDNQLDFLDRLAVIKRIEAHVAEW